MLNRIPPSAISLDDFSIIRQTWELDAQAAGFSPRYCETMSDVFDKLAWWATEHNVVEFSPITFRQFFIYLQTAHDQGGRWGTETKKLKPQSVVDYWRRIRTWCNWAVDQGIITTSPFAGVPKPIARHSETSFHVFTQAELQALEKAIAKTAYPVRDAGIFCLLLDTGLRASELVGLTWADCDLGKRQATVREDNAKGGKQRLVYWSASTGKALWRWVQQRGGTVAEEHVFVALNGSNLGGGLTRVGLGKICARWGKDAGIQHCHPHTFRHTFATSFLAAGGSQISLMELMGHSSISMTQKYVRFSNAELAVQSRRFSPVETLKKSNR